MLEGGAAGSVIDRGGRLLRDVRKFVEHWRSRGAKEAFRGLKAVLLGPLYLWVDRRFDRRYQLDTTTNVPLADLTIKSSNFDYKTDVRKYQATPAMAFRAAMSVLPNDLSAFSFVDFGSGKGRVLLMASEYNFRRLVGIEFSKELHAIACQNVARFSEMRERNLAIELINDDVIHFQVPNEACVLYLYNPFPDNVISAVLSQVAESYHTAPRKLYLIYLNPKFYDAFERLGFLRVVRRGRFGPLSGVVYETVIKAHPGVGRGLPSGGR